ncbi:MAG: hypothetical protein EZS28_018294 [Streblomastix strix]|uniref:Uncharacterized protein n=1 Tax=Streblomastix strix TaxID=222440 RepID=A0A5J4VV64_9EUKA|nr:MAG: hypothetical protein EZS28_018294 [Streblomastix strix]
MRILYVHLSSDNWKEEKDTINPETSRILWIHTVTPTLPLPNLHVQQQQQPLNALQQQILQQQSQTQISTSPQIYQISQYPSPNSAYCRKANETLAALKISLQLRLFCKAIIFPNQNDRKNKGDEDEDFILSDDEDLMRQKEKDQLKDEEDKKKRLKDEQNKQKEKQMADELERRKKLEEQYELDKKQKKEKQKYIEFEQEKQKQIEFEVQVALDNEKKRQQLLVDSMEEELIQAKLRIQQLEQENDEKDDLLKKKDQEMKNQREELNQKQRDNELEKERQKERINDKVKEKEKEREMMKMSEMIKRLEAELKRLALLRQLMEEGEDDENDDDYEIGGNKDEMNRIKQQVRKKSEKIDIYLVLKELIAALAAARQREKAAEDVIMNSQKYVYYLKTFLGIRMREREERIKEQEREKDKKKREKEQENKYKVVDQKTWMNNLKKKEMRELREKQGYNDNNKNDEDDDEEDQQDSVIDDDNEDDSVEVIEHEKYLHSYLAAPLGSEKQIQLYNQVKESSVPPFSLFIHQANGTTPDHIFFGGLEKMKMSLRESVEILKKSQEGNNYQFEQQSQNISLTPYNASRSNLTDNNTDNINQQPISEYRLTPTMVRELRQRKERQFERNERKKMKEEGRIYKDRDKDNDNDKTNYKNLNMVDGNRRNESKYKFQANKIDVYITPLLLQLFSI